MHALLTRLLLLPLLSPLLAVLLIAAVNPRPWVALRLLTWTSPAWPLGGWLASGVAVGAGLSAAGTALALQGQGPSLRPRRQVRRGAAEAEAEAEAPPEPRSPRPRGEQPRNGRGPAPWAGPSRGASDPPPTVSVPFRVIRRGRPAAASATARPAPPSSGGAEDWNTPTNDDW